MARDPEPASARCSEELVHTPRKEVLKEVFRTPPKPTPSIFLREACRFHDPIPGNVPWATDEDSAHHQCARTPTAREARRCDAAKARGRSFSEDAAGLTPSKMAQEACRFEQPARQRPCFQPVESARAAREACRFFPSPAPNEAPRAMSLQPNRCCEETPRPRSRTFSGQLCRTSSADAPLSKDMASSRAESAARLGDASVLTPTLESISASRRHVAQCDPGHSVLTASLESRSRFRYELEDGHSVASGPASPRAGSSRHYVALCDPSHSPLTPSAAAVAACRFFDKTSAAGTKHPEANRSTATHRVQHPAGMTLGGASAMSYVRRRAAAMCDPGWSNFPTASSAMQQKCRYHVEAPRRGPRGSQHFVAGSELHGSVLRSQLAVCRAK